MKSGANAGALHTRAMAETSAVVRQLDLAGAAQFARNLARALAETGAPAAAVRETLASLVEAQCVRCGIRLSADDLLALADTGEPDQALAPKAARLRQGYCARSGCESYYYQITCRPGGGLDWNKVLAGVETASQAERSQAAEDDAAHAQAAKRTQRRRLAARVLIGVAVVLVLLLIRQWVTGGAIPLIRQPAKYKADPASVGERPPE